MKTRVANALALALFGATAAGAQQPAPPAPAFAAPNLGDKGVRSMAANCAACHGTSGRPAPGSTVQGLAGRPRDELVLAMAQFKKGDRPATLMHQIAKGFGDDEIAALADHFSKQPR
jgi:cytochrome subunit of sulfide dehydrogenase